MNPLPTDVSTLHQIIQDLRALVEAQAKRIAELEARLNANSGNSHRPPSSDGYGKKAALPKEKKAGGGQKGHRGDTLKMVDQADEVQPCYATACACGQLLLPSGQEMGSRRQVFDLPEPKLRVVEYRQYGCACPACGSACRGSYPAGVEGPVQYGPGVKALCVLLTQGYCLSLEKTGQLFADLFGQAPNEQTLLQAQATAYERLAASEAAIRAQLARAPVVHADETGLRVGGKLQWLHSASDSRWTYLHVHPKRGTEALEGSASVLKTLGQWLVHDCWGAYFKLENVLHALCGAHLLRELQAQAEQGRQWAAAMHAFLLGLYHQTRERPLAAGHLGATMARFEAICQAAHREEPPPEPHKHGRPRRTKGRNLFERMRTYHKAVLAFAFHHDVPFTNNLAERDIRPIKLKQKVAGCFRTSTGATHFARILGFISTSRKHHRHVFLELRHAFEGHTFITSNEAT